MSKVTVSILTYTALEHSKRCIQTVLSHTKDVHLILTANGNPKVAAYFQELASQIANITVVVNEKNEGFWKPNNHAFSLCRTPYFVMLNDDAVPPPGWLDKLMAPLEENEKGAVSGPDDGCCSLHDTFHGFRGPMREYVEGSCMMVKTDVARQHGLFEEMPAPAYGEDSFLSLRYRELGYTLHWVPLRVPHVRAATSRHIPDVRRWQQMNHAFLRRRFSQYLLNRNMASSIIIRRSNAVGDVLLVTPVIRALRQEMPMRKIMVETMHPEIFLRNPDVEKADRRIPGLRDARRFNLDGSYEAKPAAHFVHTYAEKLGIKVNSTKTCFYPSKQDYEWAARVLIEKDWIMVHPGPSTWRDKQWPINRFEELVKWLSEAGHRICLVGSRDTRKFGEHLDLRGKTTLHQLGAAYSHAKLFIGLDSAPMHIAQAMGIPVVPIFGVTSPEFILTDGSPAKPVVSDPNHPGTGLRHRQSNKTSVVCDSNPCDTITTDQVFAAVQSMLSTHAPVV